MAGLAPLFSPGIKPAAKTVESSLDASNRSGPRACAAEKPWGNFEYIKLPLEEPDELLPDTSKPLAPPRWFFENYSSKQLADLFQSCDLRHEQRTLLLDSKNWEQSEKGIFLSPSSEVLLGLSRSAREKIYGALAESEGNSPQRDPFRFRPEAFEQWAAAIGLGQEQVDILRRLTYMQGGSLCFCDGSIVQRLFSPGDFRRLVRALYGERTFLMRLVVNADTDIDALIKYWGKGGRAHALRPLFQSLARVPGGSTINVSYLLPTFARVRLYTYASEWNDVKATNENCFWTAMNFFSEKPDPQFLSAKYTLRALETGYFKCKEAPLYGDLILITDSQARPIHLCVYLADGVVFTKNGGDFIQPWVLMKIPDMLAYYNARQPAQLTVFRSKQQ